MKNYKYLSFLVFFAIVLSSCLSKKNLTVGNSVLENDLSILNGTYKNIAVNSRTPQDEFSLYLLLFKNFHWQNPYYNNSDDYLGSIRLTAISDNKIKIERFVDGEIVKTKTLKGKVHENFFLTKRKWRILGIPIFFGSYNESVIAIGLKHNGYLDVRKIFEFTGGIIALGANSNIYIENAYYAKTDSDEQEIYNETMNLLDSLAYENSDKCIFYKTDIHSIDSHVWYDRDDSIISYRITPDGTETRVVMKPYYRTPFNPTELPIPPILRFPNANKSLIGYCKFIDGKIIKYGIEVTDKWISESERTFQDNDFIRKVNEDMVVIKKGYGINFHYNFY